MDCCGMLLIVVDCFELLWIILDYCGLLGCLWINCDALIDQAVWI